MKPQHFLKLAIAAAALALGAVGSAQAASTFVFGGTGTATSGGDPLAKTTYTTAETSLSISGAYATSGSTSSGFASTTTWNTGTGADVLYYSGNGLGMASDGSTAPNHAIDNNGNTEAVMLSFGQSVKLTSVGIGYKNTDADISIFRYTGTSVPPPNLNLVGASLANMASAGWSLVSNYANLTVDTSAPFTSVNAGGLSSSFWLISAYNASYGNGTNLDQGNDYFKLYGITTTCANGNTGATGTTACKSGTTSSTVPEPGSLGLVAVGLLGLVGLRRRRV